MQISLDVYAFRLAQISKLANQIKAFLADNNKMRIIVKKMAAAPGRRFSFATDSLIEELKNSSKNENTTKSTLFWQSVWRKWCAEKEIEQEIHDIPPEELNILLERFYDYEPDSLKVMLTALDRHLKDKGYDLSIIRDREFSSSKQVLEGKAN